MRTSILAASAILGALVLASGAQALDLAAWQAYLDADYASARARFESAAAAR